MRNEASQSAVPSAAIARTDRQRSSRSAAASTSRILDFETIGIAIFMERWNHEAAATVIARNKHAMIVPTQVAGPRLRNLTETPGSAVRVFYA